MKIRLDRLPKFSGLWRVLTLAVGVGGLMAYLALQYLQGQAQQQAAAQAVAERARATQVAVLVPIADLQAGTVISQAQFAGRPIDEDLVTRDTVLATAFPSVAGLKLTQSVQKGRPVRLGDIQPAKVWDVSTVVKAGSRAMTIDIDADNSMAQMLRPGNRVDLFLLASEGGIAMPGEAPRQAARLFMQNVVVLATGQTVRRQTLADNGGQPASSAPPGEREPRFDTVTLEVSPEQAGQLALAPKLGSLRAVLRAEGDQAPVQVGIVSARALLGESAPTLRPVGRKSQSSLLRVSAPESAPVVEYIVGGKAGGPSAARSAASVAPFSLADSRKPQS